MTHRKIRMESPQRNEPYEGGLSFFGDFRPICRHISKTVHFRHKVTMGRYQETIGSLSNGVSFDDLE